jgi:hypothetical protein
MISAQDVRNMQRKTAGELKICEERIVGAAQHAHCVGTIVKLNCPERCIPMLKELGYATNLLHYGYLYIGWGKE